MARVCIPGDEITFTESEEPASALKLRNINLFLSQQYRGIDRQRTLRWNPGCHQPEQGHRQNDAG
jgi:hypothetical protein